MSSYHRIIKRSSIAQVSPSFERFHLLVRLQESQKGGHEDLSNRKVEEFERKIGMVGP